MYLFNFLSRWNFNLPFLFNLLFLQSKYWSQSFGICIVIFTFESWMDRFPRSDSLSQRIRDSCWLAIIVSLGCWLRSSSSSNDYRSRTLALVKTGPLVSVIPSGSPVAGLNTTRELLLIRFFSDPGRETISRMLVIRLMLLQFCCRQIAGLWLTRDGLSFIVLQWNKSAGKNRLEKIAILQFVTFNPLIFMAHI